MRLRRVFVAAALALLIAGTGQAVVINEFYYGTEPPGDNEWVELYNKSGFDIDLTNWQIAVANNGPFAIIHTITAGDPGTTITTQDFFLVADAVPATATVTGANLNLGRDTGTVVYGIALLDDTGTTVDTVLYAPAGASNTYLLEDDTGSTALTRVKLVGGDESYYRFQNQDTDDSSADFFGSGGPGTPVPVDVRRFILE